ncbi:hypothetical protein BD626DRAFT_254904 [Schizophyllum amplum]|uniref:Uncharacterized protein n=1 Tax=Schizophyllum amplum TaxID=97359 RepID=A0A550CIF4_9AGAR|nr:hypothetical protein BD626DRAFT_254904 [Auriculariopsis ampla]
MPNATLLPPDYVPTARHGPRSAQPNTGMHHVPRQCSIPPDRRPAGLNIGASFQCYTMPVGLDATQATAGGKSTATSFQLREIVWVGGHLAGTGHAPPGSIAWSHAEFSVHAQALWLRYHFTSCPSALALTVSKAPQTSRYLRGCIRQDSLLSDESLLASSRQTGSMSRRFSVPALDF